MNATSAGIAAALAVAEGNRDVLLIEPTGWIGGMTTLDQDALTQPGSKTGGSHICRTRHSRVRHPTRCTLGPCFLSRQSE
ncbi:MAG: FAD-dependent oxidoreductase [Rubripirellula sp.]